MQLQDLNDYLNLSCSFNFAWPKTIKEKGLFWTNKADFVLFEDILDRLFLVSKKDYLKYLDEVNFKEIIEFDPENSKTQIFLSDLFKYSFSN